jgi:hypothetical protein
VARGAQDDQLVTAQLTKQLVAGVSPVGELAAHQVNTLSESTSVSCLEKELNPQVFYDVMLCRRYTVTNILDKSAVYMTMEDVRSSETLVTIYPPQGIASQNTAALTSTGHITGTHYSTAKPLPMAQLLCSGNYPCPVFI